MCMLELTVTAWWIIVANSVFLTGLSCIVNQLATCFLTFYCDPYFPFLIQNFCLYLLCLAYSYRYIQHMYNNVYIQTARGCYITTVPLKGNVTLALHSTLDPRELDTLYSRSNTHITSKHKAVNHSGLVRVLSIVFHSSLGLIPTASSGEY